MNSELFLWRTLDINVSQIREVAFQRSSWCGVYVRQPPVKTFSIQLAVGKQERRNTFSRCLTDLEMTVFMFDCRGIGNAFQLSQVFQAAFGGDKHLPDPQYLQHTVDVVSGRIPPENEIEINLVNEKMINNELVSELFIRSAYLVRSSIGRIMNGNKAIGTGFRVSKRLVMTAAHVAQELEPGNSFIQFHHYDFPITNCPANDDETPKFPGVKFQNETFHSNENAPLDYAILATVEEIPEQVSTVKYIYEGGVQYLLGKHINIFSHPEGSPIKCSLRKNLSITQKAKEKFVTFPGQAFDDSKFLGNQDVILHEADTKGGSSGAPMFNDNFQLIGIHQGYASFSHGADRQTKPYVCNRGCVIKTIICDMYSQEGMPHTEFEQKLKVKEAELGVPFEGSPFTTRYIKWNG